MCRNHYQHLFSPINYNVQITKYWNTVHYSGALYVLYTVYCLLQYVFIVYCILYTAVCMLTAFIIYSTVY